MSNIRYIGQEVMILFPQKTKGFGFIQGWGRSALIGGDPLKILATEINPENCHVGDAYFTCSNTKQKNHHWMTCV